MRILITGTVAILIILGLVKTIQDYEMTNDTSRQLSDNKDDDKVIHLNDDKVIHLNNFKNLHAKEFNPSDFF
ncbi:hypothetical protein USA300LVJ_25170 [Staphylococcus aureus]|uniref:hypothetical protein n=1 Tax=Staphylococcus aureus TaxID=1280 RepID=UPI001597F5EB|nr:hypothetical protein [Staphylococcus aureus]BCD44737.1 hypothetical protein USA300LVJ_25170 [Staphylococcus aureus]